METDVAVVGAGPAGVAASVHLARAGLGVILLDKATFPRDKVCGDGLTTAALRELEDLGLSPERVGGWTPVDGVVIRSPSGRSATFPLPTAGGYAAIAPRRELDAALVDRARAEGVQVLEATALESAAGTEGSVVLSTSSGVVRATMAVGADGMWSPLRRTMGLSPPGYRGEWHAFRQYHEDVDGPAAVGLHVMFEPDLLPGYLWSFPLPRGRANVGFGIVRGGRRQVGDMRTIWADLLARPHVRAVLGPHARPAEPARAWPIPARIDRMPVAADRVLFVGDAAAACDVLTGEGIGQALQTGRLAAEAIAAAQAEPADAGRRYRASLEATLVPDHRMSSALNRVLSHRTGARVAVALAASTPWTRRNFARWLFEDSPRGIALTPTRWRRGALTGDGAFTSAPGAAPASTAR